MTERERDLARRLHMLAGAYGKSVDVYSEVAGDMAAVMAAAGADNRRFTETAHGAAQQAREFIAMLLDGVPDPRSGS